MPKRSKATMAIDIYKALFERKTTQGRINKLIDSQLEDNFFADEAAHFFNEVIIHKHPRQHIRNTLKYGIKPRIKKGIDKLMP